ARRRGRRGGRRTTGPHGRVAATVAAPLRDEPESRRGVPAGGAASTGARPPLSAPGLARGLERGEAAIAVGPEGSSITRTSDRSKDRNAGARKKPLRRDGS